MNQPLTPEDLAVIRDLAARAARSDYEVVTSSRGIEVLAVDPDDCKSLIATLTDDRKDFAYLAVQAPTLFSALLAELDRVRAERDAFADRVDTLTAVAKSNKRHVQEMHAEVQKANRERDEVHRVYADERDLRIKAEAERDGLKKRIAELEEAAICPSVANAGATRCVLPIRHRGDHRDPEKRHFWSDEYAAPTA